MKECLSPKHSIYHEHDGKNKSELMEKLKGYDGIFGLLPDKMHKVQRLLVRCFICRTLYWAFLQEYSYLLSWLTTYAINAYPGIWMRYIGAYRLISLVSHSYLSHSFKNQDPWLGWMIKQLCEDILFFEIKVKITIKFHLSSIL